MFSKIFSRQNATCPEVTENVKLEKFSSCFHLLDLEA